MQPLHASPLLAEEARCNGFCVPNALPYVYLLADGGKDATMLMNGVLGVLELQVIRKTKLPSNFALNIQVLATDAMVVVMRHGRAVVEPTVLYGKGQMPHNLCLAPFSTSEWMSRVEADDPDVRVKYLSKWITMQAHLTRSAHTTADDAYNNAESNERSSAWLEELLRATWLHMLCMFGYYMSDKHARLAFGTSAARGLHSFRWWRSTMPRCKAKSVHAFGFVVLYSDACPFQSVAWNTRDFDGDLMEAVIKQLRLDGKDYDWKDEDSIIERAHEIGWVVNKAELTRVSARASWLLSELNGEHALCCNDGDGSEWQLQWLQQATMQTLQPSVFMHSVSHRSVLSWEDTRAQLKLHVLARRSVQSIVMFLCRTAGVRWASTQNRLRGVLILHSIERTNGWSPKLVAAFHKTCSGGQGKALWGQELNDEAAMEVVARLSPLVGGKWHEWEHLTEWRKKHPRSKVPFEADDLCEAEEFLHGDDEKATVICGLKLRDIRMLNPKCIKQVRKDWGLE